VSGPALSPSTEPGYDRAPVPALSIPYCRHDEKKFYFYRHYDAVSIRELIRQAMTKYPMRMLGQCHPVNRKKTANAASRRWKNMKECPISLFIHSPRIDPLADNPEPAQQVLTVEGRRRNTSLQARSSK